MHNILSAAERVKSMLSMTNTMCHAPKEGDLNPYVTWTAPSVAGAHGDGRRTLTHLFWDCWVMSSQYHLIMMSSRIWFSMRLVDGTSVWFSSVLAWGAMSWKAIRSIKRSTGMAWAAMVCSSRRRETKREKEMVREKGLDRLSQLLADRVALWNLVQDICPVKQQKFVSEYAAYWMGVKYAHNICVCAWCTEHQAGIDPGISTHHFPP